MIKDYRPDLQRDHRGVGRNTREINRLDSRATLDDNETREAEY